MEKLVTLKLKGDFNRGFDATLKIKQGNTDLAEVDGKLPPNPEIILTFEKWQEALEIQVTTEVTRGFKKVNAETTNFSCVDLAKELNKQLNIWLKSTDADWQDIRDCLLQNLHPNEETRLIIQTTNPLLRRLPLSVWELFDDQHFNAEIALSPSQFRFSEFSPSKSKKVRILAVLGNSTIEGSTIDTDFDKRQFQQLEKQGAKVELLCQPTAQKLREYLWDNEGWDIFFFAGHSNSNDDGTIGTIELNENETLSINDFQEALKAARERGLQIAVFNSCDGLGLANSLVELNLPQIIVMRETVPDEVAREFLQYFLTAFARENCSLYTALREARRKLENFEAKFPGVKGLPVIAQHPAATPPTWDRLRGRSGGRVGGGDWTREGLLTRQEFKNPHSMVADRTISFIVTGMSLAIFSYQVVKIFFPEFPIIFPKQVQLRSERGIDYSHLQNLLASQYFKEADVETRFVILQVAEREEEGWLDVEDIDNFPCEDLRIIDHLWLKYSNGHFGISVQKQIYQELGGSRKRSVKIWDTFGDRVGWRQEQKWKDYDNMTWEKVSSPRGHLPRRGVGWGCAEGLICERFLFSRAEICNL